MPVRSKGGRVIQPVHIVRLHNNKQIKIKLIDHKGRVRPAARKAVSNLARAKRGRKRTRLLGQSD